MRGFSTGTTAAAACKAAVLSLVTPVSSVEIAIPCGMRVIVSVEGRGGKASSRKYVGDYSSDITADLEFVATARPLPEGIRLVPLEGIGRFSRGTPRYKKGEPAISRTTLDCVERAIEEGCREGGIAGVEVTLAIPEGAEIAKRTLNPKVGVDGGLSILGSTGLVEPWDDHLAESVMDRVASAHDPVLTTGRIGLRYARLLFPDRDVILIGAKIREAIASARGKTTLCGLPALILRFISPGILEGTGFATVEELSVTPAFKEIMEGALMRFSQTHPTVHVVIVDRDGCIMGESP
jgi:cobalt-precorrin-5B (C1)-methyltransferase